MYDLGKTNSLIRVLDSFVFAVFSFEKSSCINSETYGASFFTSAIEENSDGNFRTSLKQGCFPFFFVWNVPVTS